MTLSSLRRKTAVLLLGAILATPLVSVASPRAFSASPGTAGPLEALLTHLWGTFTALWSEEGCSPDPYGRCIGRITTSPPVTPDNGCSPDPYGGCAGAAASSGETLDAGCSPDPYGGCSGGS
jgi:hypothetical protein